MFKREKPLSPLQHLKEIFWPSMGWKRAVIYTFHRIVRLSDTPAKIAAGLAVGASISFSPLLGLHFVQAGAIAYFLRINILAAFIGTFVGTPWTFPFIWYWSIRFGAFICNAIGLPATDTLPTQAAISSMWEIAMNDPVRILIPWMIGGYLLALLLWPIFYFIFFHVVRVAKMAREARA